MEASFLNRVEVKKNGFGQTADFVTTGNFFPQGKICETLSESFFSKSEFWGVATCELPNALKSAAAVLLGALHSGASAWHQGDLLREKTTRRGGRLFGRPTGYTPSPIRPVQAPQNV